MTEQLLSVTDFLDAHEVEYEIGHHTKAYTAQEIAGSSHVPGKYLLKPVIVKAGDHFIMVVISAIHLLDFAKLEKATGIHDLALATEGEVARLFPTSEVGAEPPFGSWEGQEMPVYLDKSLEGSEYVVFSGGSHTETIKMKFGDYKRLADPTIADIGIHI